LPEGVSQFKQVLESNEELKDKEDELNHAKDELTKMHYKLGHMSFAKIKFMATMGNWLNVKSPVVRDVYMERPSASHGGPKRFPTAF